MKKITIALGAFFLCTEINAQLTPTYTSGPVNTSPVGAGANG